MAEIDQSVLDQIRRTKSIVEYLEKKGHHPVKTLTGGRLAYNCPLPDHEETKPSFYVWTQGEFQNFHCFGCQRHFHIVHLYMYMEGVSYERAFELLSDGVDVSPQECLKLDIERFDKFSISPLMLGVSQTLMSISSLARNYIQSVNFEEGECRIMDKFWASVDADIGNFDFGSIEETLEYLPEVLLQRKKKFKAIQLELAKKAYTAKA